MTMVLLVNYNNVCALEIHCHSLQSYAIIGSPADLFSIYDKLCNANTDVEERSVGCEAVPHHEHDCTSNNLLVADLHRMGVMEESNVDDTFWRISRANSSFVVTHLSLPLLYRFVQPILVSLPFLQASLTRWCFMLLVSGQGDDFLFSPTDMPRMVHP